MLTFQDYVAQYEKDKSVRWIEPMSSHEINLVDYPVKNTEYAELKYDGPRGLIHFGEVARCFSRVPSKVTGWFTENTDNVPHIRDSAFPGIFGTILDGEFDYGSNSNGVQSVMGALPEKAIQFQEENGYIPFKAFDILYYKGINVQRMPLWKRKIYLAMIIMEIYDFHGEESSRYFEYATMYMRNDVKNTFLHNLLNYPLNLKDALDVNVELNNFIYSHIQLMNNYLLLYEEFIDEGFEGIMVKNLFGIYEQKRSKNYLKAKGQSTWDCVVMGFTPPTKEYTGKELHKWKYWSDGDLVEETLYIATIHSEEQAQRLLDMGHVPVTKPYYMGWCGAIQFGVWKPFDEDYFLHKYYDDIDYGEYALNQMFDKGELRDFDGETYQLVHVGDCKGLTEKQQEFIKSNSESLIGTVVEVKANGILDKETGSLRHPRFQKWRKDKSSEMCKWEDHLANLGGK